MNSRICRCFTIACLVLPAWCRAEENGRDSEPKIYVGAAAVVTSKPYEGVDEKVYPIPMFAYEGRRLYFRGVGAGYRLLMGKGWSIGPVIQPRLDGYEEDDSPALEGMDDRDWSIDAGVGVSWLTAIGLFDLSFVTDILSRHNGQELQFSYTITFPVGGFDVVPSIGVRRKTDNLVDYYYGVEFDELAFDRPPFEGDDATDPYVRLAVRRKLGTSWEVVAAAQYEWLADEITDSPIVDDDYQASLLVGFLYSW